MEHGHTLFQPYSNPIPGHRFHPSISFKNLGSAVFIRTKSTRSSHLLVLIYLAIIATHFKIIHQFDLKMASDSVTVEELPPSELGTKVPVL